MKASRLAGVVGLLVLAAAVQAQPLPIDAALRQVREEAPQVLTARERLVAAHGALDQADRLPNPLLELREENLTFNSHGPTATDPSIDFFATLSQPIELGGKRAQRRAIASADITAASADRDRVDRELLLETAGRYLAGLRAREELRTLQVARAEFQSLVETMQRRVRDGYAPEADLMKLRTEAARADASLSQIRIERDRNLAALAALLGETTPVSETRLVVPKHLEPPSGDRQALITAALARHPDLQAAIARVDRAQHMFDLERARRIPDPALTAGYKRTASINTVVTGVTVPLPVFDANQGNVTRAGAEARAAIAERDTLQRQLTAEIDTLLSTADELARRAQSIDADLLHPADVVRSAARSSFHEGATNILQLVDAERVYTDAQRTALTLVLDAYGAALAARLACLEEPLP